jgi:hypothetical protein
MSGVIGCNAIAIDGTGASYISRYESGTDSLAFTGPSDAGSNITFKWSVLGNLVTLTWVGIQQVAVGTHPDTVYQSTDTLPTRIRPLYTFWRECMQREGGSDVWFGYIAISTAGVVTFGKINSNNTSIWYSKGIDGVAGRISGPRGGCVTYLAAEPTVTASKLIVESLVFSKTPTAPLKDYTYGTFVVNFTGPWAAEVAVTMRYCKVGKFVTMTWPNIAAAGNNTADLVTSSGSARNDMPATITPGYVATGPVQVNNGANVSFGYMAVDSARTISFRPYGKNAAKQVVASGVNFGPSVGTIGIYAGEVTWVVTSTTAKESTLYCGTILIPAEAGALIPKNLTEHYDSTFSLTMKGPWGATTYPMTFRYVRIGNLCELSWDGIANAAASTASHIYATNWSTNFPPELYPSDGSLRTCKVVDNGVTCMGWVHIYDNGEIEIYSSTEDAATFNAKFVVFTASGTAGINPQSFTYTVGL